MPDQNITKLRIKLRRAIANERAVEAECIRHNYAARRAREVLQEELGACLEAQGLCPYCEQPKALCHGHIGEA